MKGKGTRGKERDEESKGRSKRDTEMKSESEHQQHGHNSVPNLPGGSRTRQGDLQVQH